MSDSRPPAETPTSSTSGANKRWEPPSPEELQALMPGYVIEKLLGKGGMGAVYKGIQSNLERPVAIKIISNDLDEADASYGERFKNEAKAMAKLNHPGIVAVFDYGQTSNGILYIVMEFVDGTDVSRMIAKAGRLQTAHAMAITAHVCDALAYAHERGIIHRDIKPANIMVGYDGVVKVADFGLAKMTQSQNTGLTRSGMAMGTLHYMAPEALMLGSAVDHRADIYAVGVMLYQMLTGKIPQGMFKLPSLQIPGLDPRYDAIITKAIMEDREARYQNVSEMRRDLDGILTQPVVKVEPEGTRAPAALPTQARPQRPGGQPYHPSEPVAPPQAGLAWLWMTLLILSVFGGIAWLVFGKSGGSSHASQEQAVTADGPTAPVAATALPAMPGQSSGSMVGRLLATKDKPFENSLGMKFVPVPGTKVLFCIWETRVRDYSVFAETTKTLDETWTHQTSDGIPVGREPEHPVCAVNWYDAKAFCEWLTQKEVSEAWLVKGSQYRLPTDEEWSLAAGLSVEQGSTPLEKGRRNIISRFPWNGAYPPQGKAGNYADATYDASFPGKDFPIKSYVDGFATTAPVGSFAPNESGIFDLGGNVWEWCEDWSDSTQTTRVLRGASWNDASNMYLRSSVRQKIVPSVRQRNNDGFRVVIELPGYTAAASGSAGAPNGLPATSPGTVAAPAARGPEINLSSFTKEKPFENSLGMKFVPVTGTKVLFSIWDTRAQDWERFEQTTTRPRKPGLARALGPTHPMTPVSWTDAKEFCAWLTEEDRKQGRIGSAQEYRLPSDAEWSMAVGLSDERGNTPYEKGMMSMAKTMYPWGTSWPPAKGAGNVGPDLGVDDYEATSPVGSFPPNSFGLYDMGTNVTQWCEDKYDETTKGDNRVLRGGNYGHGQSGAGNLRIGWRGHNLPTAAASIYGFRCVLVTDDMPAAVSKGSSTADSKLASKEKPFENSLGMKFVPVPGTKPLFSIWDTRMQDYQVFAKETGREVKTGREYNLGPTYPIVMITWDDAKAFCAWLTERDRKSQVIGPGDVYRLPTDEEWSVAAGLQAEPDGTPEKKSGRISGYPWGTDKMPPKNYGNFMGEGESPPLEGFKKMWTMGYKDGFAFASAVGTFPPDANGLFDMMGNVYQYVEDWYDEQNTYRTLRGATFWGYIKTTSQRTRRSRELAGDFNIGFRCVLELNANRDMDAAAMPKP